MTSIIILFITICAISFFCSLYEAVILSVTPVYVAMAVKSKKRSGILLRHLTENMDRPLAAILTMNTISNTLGSAVLAFQIQHQYGDTMVTIVSGLLTIFVLIFSEIIPKILGSSNWKVLAPSSAYFIQTLIIGLYPFVAVSKWLNNKLTRQDDTPELTREEMIMTAEIGAVEGTIHSKESAVIKNLLMLNQIYISDIMTPRSVLFALEDIMTVEEVAQKYKPLRFSRVPVYHETLDNIIGMTHRYKILESLSADEHNKKIGDLIVPIKSLPEQMPVSQALDFFIKEKEHLALAIDEYGVTTGIVTLEDAVETLLGVEIVDEFDNIEDMRKYAIDQWQQRKQKLRRT